MSKPIQQQIALLQAKLARAQEKQRQASARVAFIVGDTLISAARQNEQCRQQVLQMLDRYVLKPRDIEEIAGVVTELNIHRQADASVTSFEHEDGSS